MQRLFNCSDNFIIDAWHSVMAYIGSPNISSRLNELPMFMFKYSLFWFGVK